MRISDWSSDVCSSDLRRPDFKDRGPAGREQARQVGNDAAIGVEPVGAGKKRRRGLMVGDIGHQRLAGGDIGRIAAAEVKGRVAIGRASSRERGWYYAYISVVPVNLNKKVSLDDDDEWV